MPWWLLACADPPAAGPRCPELDFAVVLGSSVPDRVSHVLPLPDGDVLLAGYYAGAPAVAPGGPPLPVGYGARDGFVARVSPDGDVRWQHGFGGSGADDLTMATSIHGRVWVAATVDGLEVLLDGVPLPGTSEGTDDNEDLSDAAVLVFDLEGGEVLTTIRLSQDSSQHAMAATGDGMGNLYLSGEFRSDTIAVGPWTHDNTTVDQGIRDEQAFLASFTADGTPRWLTTWGNDSFARPVGVGWLGDALIVGGTWGRSPNNVVTSDGTLRPASHGVFDVLGFDPRTGAPVAGAIASSGLDLGSVRALEQVADGGVVLTGSTGVGRTWITADGTTHTVPPTPSGNPYPWFRAKLDATGDLVDWWSDDPLLWGSSATSDPMAVAGWANELHDPDGSVVFDPPDHLTGHDGMAATFDADNQMTCAWLFAGDDDESALDAAFDARGGLWVVGEFSEQTLVTNSEGETVAEWTADGSTDGFVLRFRGAADP